MARRQPASIPRPRPSSTATTASATMMPSRARATPGGDPRLGDGDDRRPARRRRLHDRDLGRPAADPVNAAVSDLSSVTRRPGFPTGEDDLARAATPSAAAARSMPSTGTRSWPSGRPRSSSRATTNASSPGRRRTRTTPSWRRASRLSPAPRSNALAQAKFRSSQGTRIALTSSGFSCWTSGRRRGPRASRSGARLLEAVGRAAMKNQSSAEEIISAACRSRS